jgi:HEAT repeat protein
MTAAKALGDIGDTRAVEPLIKELGDINSAAAEALGKIRDERALEPLIEALVWNEYGGRIDRKYVAEALGQLGDTRAIQPIIEAKEGVGSIPFKETCEDIIRKLQRG